MIRIGARYMDRSDTPEINIVPMIDLVFFLLIFFLVSSTLIQETGVEVRRPVAATAGSIQDSSILIAVAADGTVYMDNRQVGLPAVRALVRERLRARDLPIVIIADRESRTRSLVEVMDECRLAGARNINVATEKK
ncbi:MAG: biopolymer transporter ExbD [Planctomycetota bacterium]|nr:biopolymer transporter ExbD [Planctomycetota bacterium]